MGEMGVTLTIFLVHSLHSIIHTNEPKINDDYIRLNMQFNVKKIKE